VADEAYPHLAGRYGYAAEQVLALAAENPELTAPIAEGMPDLLAEAPFAARNEQARSVGDVLLRRTRLGLLCGRALSDPATDGPGRVSRALGRELGWDDARTDTETQRFAQEAEAEGISGR
jgi:glycerol-3-phosphate dehydrogenase